MQQTCLQMLHASKPHHLHAASLSYQLQGPHLSTTLLPPFQHSGAPCSHSGTSNKLGWLVPTTSANSSKLCGIMAIPCTRAQDIVAASQWPGICGRHTGQQSHMPFPTHSLLQATRQVILHCINCNAHMHACENQCRKYSTSRPVLSDP